MFLTIQHCPLMCLDQCQFGKSSKPINPGETRRAASRCQWQYRGRNRGFRCNQAPGKWPVSWGKICALGGIRTPNLLIRSLSQPVQAECANVVSCNYSDTLVVSSRTNCAQWQYELQYGGPVRLSTAGSSCRLQLKITSLHKIISGLGSKGSFQYPSAVPLVARSTTSPSLDYVIHADKPTNTALDPPLAVRQALHCVL